MMLLGGGSAIAFAGLRIVDLTSSQYATLALVMWVLANIVNHPHFIHSYQLFYSLKAGIDAPDAPTTYKRMWCIAAYLVPGLLAALLSIAIFFWAKGSNVVIAGAINLTGFLVGWHYVKQGFGMAMLYAAVKKCYWPHSVRRALLGNAYVCWAAAWAIANNGAVGSDFWGFFQLQVSLPWWVTGLACLAAGATTLWCSVEVISTFKQWRDSGLTCGQLPVCGIFAYAVTLYLWTVFSWAIPSYLLVIPFFHSLQYMAVVWRVKINENKNGNESKTRLGLISFFGATIFYASIVFWFAPGIIDYLGGGGLPWEAGGTFVAIACVTIFINIHHYFMDSVVWRKENKRLQQHLHMKSMP